MRLRPAILILILTSLFNLCGNAFGVEVTLLFWSDRHAHNLPGEQIVDGKTIEVGGAARLAGLVNFLREGNPNSLVLVAGDEFTGTPVSSMTYGFSEILILNEIGIDGFIPGNHEFDYGWKSLINVTDKADFPIFLANVSLEESGKMLFPSDTVFIVNAVRIGVVGLIYENFSQSVVRDGIIGLQVSNPLDATNDFIARRGPVCDLMVAVTHMGIYEDSLLAASVEGLDLIIGGHGNTPLDPPVIVNDVVIMQASPNGSRLGRIIVNVDTARNEMTGYKTEHFMITDDVAEPDKKVDKLVKKLEKKYTGNLDKKIGMLQTDWNNNQNGPCNLAQWAADAMLNQIVNRVSERTQLSVINAGNLRTDLKQGEITERDMWEIFSFENPMLIFQMSGEELKRTVQYLIDSPREYMTWGGLEVKAEAGEIEFIKVHGEPLDPLMEYAVTCVGYVWDNLDSYLHIRQDGRPNFYIPDFKQRDLLIETVIQQKVITAPLDDRWDVH